MRKLLGYTPGSSKAPIAYVDVTVNNANTASITMAAGHAFDTTISGTSYQFVNTTARTFYNLLRGVYVLF